MPAGRSMRFCGVRWHQRQSITARLEGSVSAPPGLWVIASAQRPPGLWQGKPDHHSERHCVVSLGAELPQGGSVLRGFVRCANELTAMLGFLPLLWHEWRKARVAAWTWWGRAIGRASVGSTLSLRDAQMRVPTAMPMDHQGELKRRERALQSQQESVVGQGRIVGLLEVDDPGADEAANFEQLLPIAAVSSQSSRVEAQHRADLVLVHHRNQPIEAGAICRAAGRAPEVVIDHLNVPPSRTGGIERTCVIGIGHQCGARRRAHARASSMKSNPRSCRSWTAMQMRWPDGVTPHGPSSQNSASSDCSSVRRVLSAPPRRRMVSNSSANRGPAGPRNAGARNWAQLVIVQGLIRPWPGYRPRSKEGYAGPGVAA